MKTRVLWGFLEKPEFEVLQFQNFQKNPEPEVIKKIQITDRHWYKQDQPDSEFSSTLQF